MKKLILPPLFIILAILMLPAFITSMYNRGGTEEAAFVMAVKQEEPVWETKIDEGEVYDRGFEDYIKGVVAAEMPAAFEMEALKAQAVAARTYALRHMEDTAEPDPKKIGQAYVSIDEMKKNWGDNFDLYYKKVSDAVEMTAGEIIVYDEEPIEAVFHSTSAGITESSENIWLKSLPYLKSVDSPQDENAPNFIYETEIEKNRFMEIFKQRYQDIVLGEIKILERTEAGYVKDIRVGNMVLSGREFRETLGLRSSNFTLEEADGSIIIRTKGYGHGAGMSQYGANFMAQEGSDYKKILTHYYNGVSISTF